MAVTDHSVGRPGSPHDEQADVDLTTAGNEG